MTSIRIVIPGAPRTKKTSNRVFRIGNFNKVLPSEAYVEWMEVAMRMVPDIKRWARENSVELPFKGQVWVKAIFYCENMILGDLVGYEQGLGDFLQSRRMNKKGTKLIHDGAGIITDDKHIASWDGSRVRVDKQNPRVEVEIRAYQEHLIFNDISAS